jgi:deoxycytidylate deaminase
MLDMNECTPAKACTGDQQSFVMRATQLALKSPSTDHRHGCVIVKDGRIVSEGYNHKWTHFRHAYSIHAEVHALSRLKKKRHVMPSCEMYVVRIGSDRMGNPLKFSKPCPDCTRAIEKAGIRRIYYSLTDDVSCDIYN